MCGVENTVDCDCAAPEACPSNTTHTVRPLHTATVTVSTRLTDSAYDRSPRIRRASWMSLGMIVTRLAWMAHRLVSSNRETR